MSSNLDLLLEALDRATATRNVDKLAQAKVLAALEKAVEAQRAHAAALAELDAALERMRTAR